MNQAKDTLKQTIKPINEAGRIVFKATEEEILEKMTPQKPNELPSLKRKILKNFLRKV